ncbi:MAG TPA: type II CAAX endopeptidase family protein [Gemmatimonadales bacterium]
MKPGTPQAVDGPRARVEVGRALLLVGFSATAVFLVDRAIAGLAPFGLELSDGVAVLIDLIVAWPIVSGAIVRGGSVPLDEWYPSRSFPLRALPMLALVCVAGSALAIGLTTWIPGGEGLVLDQASEAVSGGNLVGVMLLVVALAPLAEEAFFRGWLLRRLSGRLSSGSAVVIAAVLFAMFHALTWEGPLALPAGLLFGWLVVRTGSILPAIVGHAAVSGTVLLATLPALHPWSRGTVDRPSPLAEPLLLVGLCALCGVGVWSVLRRAGTAGRSRFVSGDE